MNQPYIALNDATCILHFGFGYRHINTTHTYQNERGVGAAVAESGLSHDEVWITTKLRPSEYGVGKTSQAIDQILERLGTDHIDLLLQHQQFGD